MPEKTNCLPGHCRTHLWPARRFNLFVGQSLVQFGNGHTIVIFICMADCKSGKKRIDENAADRQVYKIVQPWNYSFSPGYYFFWDHINAIELVL
jgi:hypothetical protein